MHGGGVAFAEQKLASASSSLRARCNASAASWSELAREKTGISSSTSTFSIGCRPSRSRAARRRTHHVLHHALPLARLSASSSCRKMPSQLGALRQQPEERLERQREADRDARRARRGLLRRALEHLVEPDGGRRGDAPACPIRTSRGRCRRAGTPGPWRAARLVDRAAVLVAHLPARPRDEEQLVDRGEPEERQAAQPIGELDGRQRLEPSRGARARPTGGGPRGPTTRPRRHTSRVRRDARACTRDRRRGSTGRAARRTGWRPPRRSGPRRARVARGCPRRHGCASSSIVLPRWTFSSIGSSSSTGMMRLRSVRVQRVVEVLGRARLDARIAVLERPARRKDVLPRIDQAEQPVDRDRPCAPPSRAAPAPAACSRRPCRRARGCSGGSDT